MKKRKPTAFANFGNKPCEETRHKIETSLKAQKEKFLAQTLEKEKGRSDGRDA